MSWKSKKQLKSRKWLGVTAFSSFCFHMLNIQHSPALKWAFSTVGTANLLISSCSRENLSCPFKGFCFSCLCWHLKDCGGRKLSGMSKKKKKLLELLNWVFPNVSAKGRQLFFNHGNGWNQMCNILSNLTYIKFSWNLNYRLFDLSCVYIVFSNIENTFLKIISTTSWRFKSNTLNIFSLAYFG